MKRLGILHFGLIVLALFLLFGSSQSDQSAQAQGGANNSQNEPTTLEISLPPNELLTPNQIYFGGTTCTVGPPVTGLITSCNANPLVYEFSKELSTNNTSATEDDYLILRVKGFPRGEGITYRDPSRALAVLKSLTSASAFAPPPATSLCIIAKTACAPGAKPYGFQVTFNGTNGTNGINVLLYQRYLIDHNGLTNAFLTSDANCATRNNTSPSYLCLKTQVTMIVPEKSVPQVLLESIALNSGGGGGQILFEGNVGGSGTLSGFAFIDNQNTLAVGGNVSGLTVPNKLNNYVANTKLQWSAVVQQLDKLFAKRANGTTYAFASFGGPAASQTWFLNSSTIPSASTKSSFSTPPEGKLWNVTSNSLTFGKGGVNFDGRGTIAVNGSVTFAGDFTCATGTQLGIIAKGPITFNGRVDCGAFTALEESIIFNGPVGTSGADWKGIFIARDNIKLPNVSSGTLIIHYDTDFANDPTVLFKELLGIVFSTDS